MEKDSRSTNVKKGITRLVELGRERGFVTYEDISKLAPQDDVQPEDLKNAVNVLAENDIKSLQGKRYWDPRQKGVNRYPLIVVGYDESLEAFELLRCW